MSDFFDLIDPRLYDMSLPFVVPGVRQAQNVRSICFNSEFSFTRPLAGVDVGVGTGADLASMLKGYEAFTVFGMDRSSRLMEALRSQEAFNQGAKKTIIPLEGDFSQSPSYADVVSMYPDGVDFVTSSFAIHNVKPRIQFKTFSCISKILKVGAPFFYLDLVGYESGDLQSISDRFDLQFIEETMQEVPDGANYQDWSRLADRWIRHYKSENFIVPLAASSGPSIAEMFLDAGLSQPEVLYRQLNTTLLVSRRLERP